MDAYLKMLKEDKRKITPRRKAVIALFMEQRTSLGPYEVFQKLRKKISPLGLPTVYRILEELKDLGILIGVPAEDRQLHYMLCRSPEEHHHHFVCRKCKKTEEVEYCNFDEVSRFIEKKLHGTVEQHSLHIEGLCSQCR